jgi:hypothetical protein
MGRSRTREEVPALDVDRLVQEALAAGRRRRAWVTAFYPSVSLAYRIDLDSQTICTRINRDPWQAMTMRQPGNGRWCARCIGCGQMTMDLLWVPGRSTGLCRHCHGVDLMRRQQHAGSHQHRADIRAGNTEAIASAITEGQQLQVLQAAEDEGLMPRRYTLDPTWDRRRAARAKGMRSLKRKLGENK